MQLRLYEIEPILQPFVKLICSMENDGLSPSLRPFRVLPDTCLELFINYIDSDPTLINSGKQHHASNNFIVSRMNSYMDVQSPAKMGCITVCFYPGKARSFFHLPMSELSNGVAGLEDLWKMVAIEMEDKIKSARSNEDRVQLVQQYLVAQLKKHFKPDKAVEYCLWQMNSLRGQISMAALANKTGLCNRQLVRRFNDQTGLSPKEFSRVTKFIHSLIELKKYPSISLTEVAYESGYYDQAHYIHDCREFSGYAPRELMGAEGMLF